jgi:hypothetical protein
VNRPGDLTKDGPGLWWILVGRGSPQALAEDSTAGDCLSEFGDSRM